MNRSERGIANSVNAQQSNPPIRFNPKLHRRMNHLALSRDKDV